MGCESRGQAKPSDETLRAVLLAMVPENLEEHLELNIQRFDTYSKMRSEVISFLEQKASKSLVDDGRAAPMDLDMFKAKANVRVPRHVIHVGKLDMFPKTVGMASQRVLLFRPLARAQAQKAHLLVRGPRVQRDLQKEKANHPKEKAKAR